MTAADAARTAQLQLDALPRSFVAQLGAPFLRGLHQSFLSSPYCVGLVAAADDDPEIILGFALGSTDARRHAAHVLHTSRLRLALLGARALLSRPVLLPRFARRRAKRYARRLFSAQQKAVPTVVPESAEVRQSTPGSTAVITALVVAPEGRLRGTGRQLADAFVQQAREAGAASVMLVTRADESGAASFWKRMGWQEIDVHQNLDGDLISSMTRSLR